MQNFVFKTRNNHFDSYIAVNMIIALVLGEFYSQIPTKISNSFFIFLSIVTLMLFLFKSEIKIEQNQISIKKSFLTIIYDNYQFCYNEIEISQYSIIFFNKNNLSFQLSADTESCEFYIFTRFNKEIILGSLDDFTKFKESLEEWNKQ
jgi:hypothetical protein